MATLINGTTERLEALSNKIFLNKEALINVSTTMNGKLERYIPCNN